MAKLKLGLIVGSNRKESINRKLALALAGLGSDAFEAKLIQIDDLPMYNQDHEMPVPAPVARFKGEATAEVRDAEPLSDKNLDALKAALKSVSGKDVDLNVKIDPSIIGGLVVKLGSRMVDSSLRTKLNSIKHAMKEAG